MQAAPNGGAEGWGEDFENEQCQRQHEYGRVNAEAEAPRKQWQRHLRTEEERARQDRLARPPPRMSPMIFSYRWFRNRIRNFWQESSPGVRTVTILAAITTTWITISYAYQFVFGWLFYTYA